MPVLCGYLWTPSCMFRTKNYVCKQNYENKIVRRKSAEIKTQKGTGSEFEFKYVYYECELACLRNKARNRISCVVVCGKIEGSEECNNNGNVRLKGW